MTLIFDNMLKTCLIFTELELNHNFQNANFAARKTSNFFRKF